MTKIDRSKFKGTTVKATKSQDEKVEQATGKSRNRAGRLKIKPGLNLFRLFPFHPDGGGDAYSEPVSVWYLPIDVQDRDKDNNVIKDKGGNPVMKRINKPIFHAGVHGNFTDICDEYKKFAEKVAKEQFDKQADRDRYLKPLTYDQKTKKGGLSVKDEWVAYANEINPTTLQKEFGMLSFGKAVRYRLNQLAAKEAGEDPLGTDPFTDLEEGRAIEITFNDKATRPQDYYQTEIDSAFDKTTKMIRLFPIGDEELEAFLKLPSLFKLFRNVYTRKDFDLALIGLKNFDEEWKMGVFQYEEWADICTKVAETIPEKAGDVVEDGEEKAGDLFDDMDRNEMKIFNKENNCGVFVTTKMKDEELREQLREWYAINGEPAPEEEEEEEQEEVEEEEISTTTKTEKVEKVEKTNPQPFSKKTQKEKESIKETVSKAEVGKGVSRLERLKGKK
jgi:hypothetical protein